MESDSDIPDPDYYSFFLFVSLAALLPIGFVLVALLIVLLLSSAIISSSEVAYFSLSPADIKGFKERTEKSEKRILGLLEKPRMLLATILITNNLINVAIILVSENLVDQLFQETFFRDLGVYLSGFSSLKFLSAESWTQFVDVLITVGLVTFVLVLFGEVMPKVYAKMYNVSIAKWTSRLLRGLSGLFFPLSKLLVEGTGLIERRFLAKANNSSTSIAEIDQAIAIAVGDDEHAEEDKGILKGIIKFGDVIVRQIMRNRVDVVALDFRTGYKELLQTINQSGYSRIPIYEEDFDNVLGILYIKDLLGHLEEGDDFEWQKLIRSSIFYVPEAKKLDDLLKEFQHQKQHMAIVVDEYGGSSGIVTLEDVLEEIVGEIKDEFDHESEVEFRKVDDLNYIFEGKTLIIDAQRIIGAQENALMIEDGDTDSLAGLVLELAGFIPKSGSVFKHNDYTFKIVSVSKKRIEQVLITLPNGI